MPKVLIREYDNSTTGIPAADNFAVVVPGYFGTPDEYEEDGIQKSYDPDKGLWNASDVYELKSQSDFIKYIGKHAGLSIAAAGPILNTPMYTFTSADLESSGAVDEDGIPLKVDLGGNPLDEYSTYVNKIKLERFEQALQSNGAENVYKIAEVISSLDPRYNTNSELIKTITYRVFTKKQAVDDNGNPLEVEGNPVYETDDDGNTIYTKSDIPTITTVRFEKITSAGALTWALTGGKPSYSNEAVCIIKAGQEGSNSVVDKHIGNQIAYELLGLGYTVLYKKLDPEVSANNQLSDPMFWEPLKDKSVFNFRYVMTGGCYEPAAMNQICNLATFVNDTKLEEAETYDKLSGRGDCIALCDIKETISEHEVNPSNTLQTNIANIGFAAQSITGAGQYSAIFGPKVTYVMDDFSVKDFGGNKIFPASFHYLACAARTFARYNEWYAVAGYNRGISNYSIASTSVKLGEIAINTLAPRVANNYTTKSVNLILHERGNYYLWGNRTGYALDNKGIVFHHFLNIRQLCCSIKKQLYTACRQFTFDPNSDLLWINFVNAIKPTLEAMKADQGIKGYTITKTANDKKALLTAKIRIVPIEAVEDFDISIYLEDSLTGIIVNADEAQA